MVQFALQAPDGTRFEQQMGQWSQHHQKMAYCIGRIETLPSGEKKEEWTEEASLLALYEYYQDAPQVHREYGQRAQRDTHEILDCEWIYVVLENQAYEQVHIEDYYVGCANTKQTSWIRSRFQVDQDVFYLTSQLRSSGSFAATFHDWLPHEVKELFEEYEETEAYQEKWGYRLLQTEDNEEELEVMAVNQETFIARAITLTMDEVQRALIGMEIYRFQQDIVN
ncbi:hypothetical protein [Listeria fleischmannii]|uniref:Uncharacterized protein n=1 Tax=Listeria fleischmannii FSL S10-1203 TaxID=1265822 RepID=W7D6M7_9LIST|nr:hypothetical protein [Listeria fleischmannii]EUJ44690.1 hypothetical protein MCOL2_19721 [Listeria fleischmannii FSL S10-1203]